MSLSIEEKAIAINLAMNIEQEVISIDTVFQALLTNFEELRPVITFWREISNKSPLAKGVLEKLLHKAEIELAREQIKNIFYKLS